jgi:type II secretory pathway pseudopilin PulG
MAVLVVAALPYVADYTSWAQATAQDRDAQVVAGAIARYIAVGGSTTGWTSKVNGSTAVVPTHHDALVAVTMLTRMVKMSVLGPEQ